MVLRDPTAVHNIYKIQGPLCDCLASREGPGPDHDNHCPWFANTKLKTIHLIPEQNWKSSNGEGLIISVMALFEFVPWNEVKNETDL